MTKTARRWLRRALIVTMVVALLGIGGGLTVSALHTPHFADDEVARVGGQSISSAELAAIAESEGLTLESTTQVRAGITAAARFTVLEQLAKQHGIISSTSYDDVLAQMRLANARQQATLRSGSTVYGVTQFTPQSYLAHLNSSLRTALIAKLVASGKFSTSAARLKDYYDTHANAYARASDDIRLRVLRFSADATGQAAAEHALAALQSGRSVTDVTTASGPGLERAESLHVDQSSVGELSKYHSGELSAAQALAPGSAALVPDDINAEPLLLVCQSRKAGGLQPFGKVRAETQTLYEKASLDKLISRRLAGEQLAVRPDLSAFVRG